MSIGGHHSAKARTTTWYTPPEIISALGAFDLDPCAGPVRYFKTATGYRVENGLNEPWHGRVWCNPPYTTKLVTLFLRKMSEHGNGVALVFARTETAWFFESVWRSDTCSGLLFLEGRLHFYDESGKRAPNNAGAPSVLIAYGGFNADVLKKSGIRGEFIRR